MIIVCVFFEVTAERWVGPRSFEEAAPPEEQGDEKEENQTGHNSNEDHPEFDTVAGLLLSKTATLGHSHSL